MNKIMPKWARRFGIRSPQPSEWENSDLNDFDYGMITGARQAGWNLSVTADLLGCWHTAVCTDYSEWCEKQKQKLNIKWAAFCSLFFYGKKCNISKNIVATCTQTLIHIDFIDLGLNLGLDSSLKTRNLSWTCILLLVSISGLNTRFSRRD